VALAEVRRLVTRVRLTQLARAGQFASAKLLLAQALAGALLFGNPGRKKKSGAEESRPKKQNALALPGRTFLQG